MKQVYSLKKPSQGVMPLRIRLSYTKNFEVSLPDELAQHLSYYIKQELEYFNSLVRGLTPRLRAYPKELAAMRDTEKKLWSECAEKSLDPAKLIEYPFDQWPQQVQYLYDLVFDSQGRCKISKEHINIIQIAASPGRIHAEVRKAMADEFLRHIIGQTDACTVAMTQESFKTPIQIIQEATIDNKRHLQIPKKFVRITYNETENSSNIETPYSKMPIIVPRIDLTHQPYKLLIIRAPHPYSENSKWLIDFRDDNSSAYWLNCSDAREKRKRR